MVEQAAIGKNSGQFDFWNSGSGEKWVANQAAMDHLLSALTDRLFQLTYIQSGERIIDIGCGTGATVLRAAAATGREGAVLGIDLSHPMLGLARAGPGRWRRQSGPGNRRWAKPCFRTRRR